MCASERRRGEREGCKLGGRYFDGHILCEKRRRGREVVTCARRGQWKKEGPHLRRLETESGQKIKAARHRPTFQNAREGERVLAAGDRGGQIRGALISCNLPSLAAHCPSAISSVASSKLRGGTLCRRCPPSSSVMPSHSCRSIEHRGRRNSREEEEEGIKG